MTVACRPILKMFSFEAFNAAKNQDSAAVTTFPGGNQCSGRFEIKSGDRFSLVDVTDCASVSISGGDVEILDASGYSAVTMTGGNVHFLEVAATCTVSILGGEVEFLSVADDAVVRIFGTKLKLSQDRVTGVTAYGTPLGIHLAGTSRRSIHLLPPPRTTYEPAWYGGGRWGRVG